MTMAHIFPFLLAMAMSVPLFGKGLIGVMMGVILVALVPFFMGCFKKKSVCFFRQKELGLICLLSFSWLLSGYFGLDSEKALSEACQHAGMMFGGILIYVGLVRANFKFDDFYHWVSICLGVASSIILLNVMVKFFPSDFVRNSYGSVLAMMSPFLMYQFITKQRLFDIVMLVLTLTAIFAVGGRTGWATLFITTALFVVFFPWAHISRCFVYRGICILLVVVSSVLGISLYKKSVDTVMYETRVSAVDMDRPASGRLEIWAETLQSVEKSPWIGVGIKGFRHLDLRKGPLHAHNAPLEILIDTGFVGLILVSILVLFMAARFVKYYLQSKNTGLCGQTLPILLACIGYGTASMALTSFFHAWWFLYCVVLLILLRLATDVLKNNNLK